MRIFKGRQTNIISEFKILDHAHFCNFKCEILVKVINIFYQVKPEFRDGSSVELVDHLGKLQWFLQVFFNAASLFFVRHFLERFDFLATEFSLVFKMHTLQSHTKNHLRVCMHFLKIIFPFKIPI